MRSLNPTGDIIGRLVTFPCSRGRALGIVVATRQGPGCEQHEVVTCTPTGDIIVNGPFMTHELSEPEDEDLH